MNGEDRVTLRKAAVLVSVLDSRAADALLDKMGPERAAKVRNAVMQIGEVSRAEQEQVIREFMGGGGPLPGDPEPGIELDDSLAQKLRAPMPVSSQPAVPEPDNAAPFRFLQEATTQSLARHLEREHPQVVAVVVAHLSPQRAADLVAQLPAKLQADVLRRVAELDRSDPEVIRDIEEELQTLLADEIRAARNRSAGMVAVSSILEAAGHERGELMTNLSRHDNELATMIDESPARTESRSRASSVDSQSTTAVHNSRGTQAEALESLASAQAEDLPAAPYEEPQPVAVAFEDLVELEDGELAALFRESDPRVVLLALAGASPQMADRILGQLAPREADALRRRIEQIGPTRLADIEEAQQQLARLAGQLAAQGEVKIPAHKRFAAAA